MSAKPDQLKEFMPISGIGPQSFGWKPWQSDQEEAPRQAPPQSESSQCCAYNQTSQRFLSVDVEAGDFTPSSLETRLQTLSPTGNVGLWLLPFRGISPTSVRLPIDLLYLDREYVVIEAVESFPLFRVSSNCRPAASVLVLPAQSIASTGTRSGDQLIFRPPAEMKLVIEQLSKTKTEAPQSRPSAQSPQSPWFGLSQSQPLPPTPEPSVTPLDVAHEQASDSVPTPEPQAPAKSYQSKPKKTSWLERFLSTEPQDRRTALRQPIPGLAAFFFTGGTPIPHGIRDISETGIYVLTEERWYPGTVVRMTLTNQRQPTAEQSFTANAMVMRWGNDGVGLHLMFQNQKDRRRAKLTPEDRAMGVADADSFKEFLTGLQGNRS
jgi:hypothetical protein